MSRHLFLKLGVVCVLACSGRYEVGRDPGGASAASAGDASSQAGGSASGGRASGSGARGSTGGASAGSAGSGTAATAGQGSTDDPCALDPLGGDVGPIVLPATAEIWRRLTSFLYGEALPPPADLPPMVPLSWIATEAIAMLHGTSTRSELPPGPAPVFADLLAGWIPDAREAARYAAPLSAEQAVLSDLWFAPELDDRRRIGLLTDPSLLREVPTISERGAWLQKHLFCQVLPPSPIDKEPVPDIPGMTRRQELEQGVMNAACSACHTLIDPIGMSQEHFDALGEYREIDDGQPVLASGEVRGPRSGTLYAFDDVIGLARELGGSCDVGLCFARQVWFQALERARGVPPAGLSTDTAPELASIALTFTDSGQRIDALIQRIVTSPSFASAE